MYYSFALLSSVSLALAQNPPLPVKGDNGEMGGIFGTNGLKAAGGAGGLPKASSAFGSTLGFANGAEAPTFKPGPRGTDGGSGPYKADFRADDTLPKHTIYAPKNPPPADIKMPVLVWGNGGCVNLGTMFMDFLTEIASYGYLVISNGPPANDTLVKSGGADSERTIGAAMAGGITKAKLLTDSVDWVTTNPAAKKYGNIDTSKIAAAGQSCGGLEAYSASYHDDRIKLTGIFNSGIVDPSKGYLLKELKAPVGYFYGGPVDIALENTERDYPLLPAGLPAVKASLDTGHMGTYYTTGGGKFGKAAVAFFEWQFRGDAKAKAKFTDPNAEGSLVKDKWNVTMKNF